LAQLPLTNAIVLTVALTLEVVPYVPTTLGAQLGRRVGGLQVRRVAGRRGRHHATGRLFAGRRLRGRNGERDQARRRGYGDEIFPHILLLVSQVPPPETGNSLPGSSHVVSATERRRIPKRFNLLATFTARESLVDYSE
jgi:hypothetical protein